MPGLLYETPERPLTELYSFIGVWATMRQFIRILCHSIQIVMLPYRRVETVNHFLLAILGLAAGEFTPFGLGPGQHFN
jgi:hypothetical protein